jgi:hypothetical protein
VADRHPVVERGQRRGDDGAGVALHQQEIGLHFAERSGEGDQRASGEIRQGLVGVGQSEVDVGGEGEGVHRLRQHFALLRGGDDHGFEKVGAATKLLDDGSHLDRLGTSSEYYGDAVLRPAGGGHGHL